jgi:hypothetical protein
VESPSACFSARGGGAGDTFSARAGEAADLAGSLADAAEAPPAEAAAPASASVSMAARAVLISTVFPSATLISASTPAAGEGISASTLSVEISRIGSSRFTRSPTFLSQRTTVPSWMLSPICGMITSTFMATPTDSSKAV